MICWLQAAVWSQAAMHSESKLHLAWDKSADLNLDLRHGEN